MNSLNVALIIKNTDAPKEREQRNMGYWSYPVPEFEWAHFWFDQNATVDLNQFRDFDLVFHEDTTNGARYHNLDVVPLVFMDIDSTLSDRHLLERRKISTQADLVLSDHAPLDWFKDGRGPARRLGYCVNDKVFHDYGQNKDIDLTFHCSAGSTKNAPGAKQRRQIRSLLDAYAKQKKLVYRSGVLGLPDYARAFNAAKICVNWPRTPYNRPHRVFDVLASRSCLVTGKIPQIDGDGLEAGRHYIEFGNQRDLITALDALFTAPERIAEITDAGHRYVMNTHTWAHCAARLRSILSEELRI
jgi:spore maturation protein CgeB